MVMDRNLLAALRFQITPPIKMRIVRTFRFYRGTVKPVIREKPAIIKFIPNHLPHFPTQILLEIKFYESVGCVVATT